MPWVLFSALYLINFCLMLFASAIPGLAVLGSVVDTWRTFFGADWIRGSGVWRLPD